MQKEEIIRKVAKRSDNSVDTTKKIVNCLLEQIKDEVAVGHKITFMNFGTFEKVWHHDRKGINPRTKTSLLIPGHFTVNFRAGKSFKDVVSSNKKKE